jgi:predicted HTH domain antitoxin
MMYNAINITARKIDGMTLTLNLTPDEAEHLEREANRRGMDTASLVQSLLPVWFPQKYSRTPLEEAMTLYNAHLLSFETAAKLAGLSAQAFLDALGQAGVSPFQYTADDVFADVQAQQ